MLSPAINVKPRQLSRTALDDWLKSSTADPCEFRTQTLAFTFWSALDLEGKLEKFKFVRTSINKCCKNTGYILVSKGTTKERQVSKACQLCLFYFVFYLNMHENNKKIIYFVRTKTEKWGCNWLVIPDRSTCSWCLGWHLQPCHKHSCCDSLFQLLMSFQVLLHIKDLSSERPLLGMFTLNVMFSDDAILKRRQGAAEQRQRQRNNMKRL